MSWSASWRLRGQVTTRCALACPLVAIRPLRKTRTVRCSENTSYTKRFWMLIRLEYAPQRSPTSFSKGGGFWRGSLSRTSKRAWDLWFHKAHKLASVVRKKKSYTQSYLPLPNALPGRFYKVAQVRRRAKTRCENLKRCRRVCHNALPPITARVVKLVDSGDSKSPAARRAGSSPAPGTTDKAALLFKQCGFFFISHVATM